MTAYNNDEGSMRDLAERFKVSFSFVASLLQKFYLNGEIAPKPHGGGQPASISASGEAFLKELILDHQVFSKAKQFNTKDCI